MGPPDANKAAGAVTTSGGEDGVGTTTPQATGDLTNVKIPKITVLRLELSTAMKDEAVTHLIEFLTTNPNAIEKDIATDMKKYFDQKHGPTWHCIVGKAFGCSVAYDTQFLLFFRADQHHILLFKSAE